MAGAILRIHTLLYWVLSSNCERQIPQDGARGGANRRITPGPHSQPFRGAPQRWWIWVHQGGGHLFAFPQPTHPHTTRHGEQHTCVSCEAPQTGTSEGCRLEDIYIYICMYVCMYPLIYTPLPNSRWLHRKALRYVRRAQLGAYMWRKGLTSFKTGSKWAKNSCSSIANGRGSILEKQVFDPFLTHFWSHNGPFSRHFGISHGPKRVTTGSKWAKTTCLSIPSGLGTTLKEMGFLTPGTLVDPPLAPTVRGLGCPPAPPSDHWYGGLGVSLGDCEAWKPQKVGGCGWTRCPQTSVLSHSAQDSARSWFWACLTQTAHIWAIFGPFLGHVVELEGTEGLSVMGQSRRTCSV